MLHMFDDLKDLTHCFHQGFSGALLLSDYLFPVPLIYIAGVQIVQLLVPADGVHVGIKAFPWLKSVFL